MDESRQSEEAAASPAESGGADAPGVRAIFSGVTGKIIFSVILAALALVSFFPLAASQGRSSRAALQAQSGDGQNENRIQGALTKKSRQILEIWAAMKVVNGTINLLQSAEVGINIGAEVSINPAEILAPIDNTLDKISNVLLWALGAVLFEKLLLALSGYVVFKAVIPACLLISIIAVWVSGGKTIWKIFAVTVMACAVVRFAIPISFELSTAVEKNLLTNEIGRIMDKISSTEEQAKPLSEDAGKLAAKVREMGVWLTKQVSNVKDLGNALIEDLINYIMVFILTNIAIPILTILGLYWFTKFLAGVILGPWR